MTQEQREPGDEAVPGRRRRPPDRHRRRRAAGWTSSISRTSSTTTSRASPNRTCTGSAGSAGRAGKGSPSRWPSRASTGSCRAIERATRQKIEIARLPTVADLRARRLELTRAAVREAVLGGDLDQFRVVVESLADEFDVMQVALAAVKLAHRAEASERRRARGDPGIRAPSRSAGGRSSRDGRAERDGPRRAGPSGPAATTISEPG